MNRARVIWQRISHLVVLGLNILDYCVSPYSLRKRLRLSEFQGLLGLSWALLPILIPGLARLGWLRWLVEVLGDSIGLGCDGSEL